MLTDDDLAAWLDELEGQDLDEGRQANVRETRREHERAVKVPSDLVERISETTSNALPVWKEAKAEDDFDAFADTLEEIIQLKRRYAEAIDPDRDPTRCCSRSTNPTSAWTPPNRSSNACGTNSSR